MSRLLRLLALTVSALLLVAAPSFAATKHHHWPDPNQQYPGSTSWDDGSGDNDGWPTDDGSADPSAGTTTTPDTSGLLNDPYGATAPTLQGTVNGTAGNVGGTLYGDNPDGGDNANQGSLLPTVPVPTTKTIKGTVALIRADGKAAIPRSAPARVKQIIAAANQIIGKPYKWGGGHAKLVDRGYDCSGAVGFSLIGAGVMTGPMVSGAMAKWGQSGAGKWVSLYANAGHVYMEVAGLRLDTSSVGDPQGRSGVRWRPIIGRRTGFHARHPLGL